MILLKMLIIQAYRPKKHSTVFVIFPNLTLLVDYNRISRNIMIFAIRINPSERIGPANLYFVYYFAFDYINLIAITHQVTLFRYCNLTPNSILIMDKCFCQILTYSQKTYITYPNRKFFFAFKIQILGTC